MKRVMKVASAFAASTLLFGMGVTSVMAASSDGTDRLFGDTRYTTSVEIAKRAFPDAKKVYVANGVKFADALTGATLGDAPLVLLPETEVKEVKEYLAGKEVVALGGEKAVSSQALAANGVTGQVSRLKGATRYETAAEIFKAVNSAEKPVVVSGLDSFAADAVVAATLHKPVLLADESGKVPGYDGTFSACVGKACSLPGIGNQEGITKLQGQTRYETAELVADAAFPKGAQAIYLANGVHYIDALVGGQLKNGPIYLLQYVNDTERLAKLHEVYVTKQAKSVVALGSVRRVPTNNATQVVFGVTGQFPIKDEDVTLAWINGGLDPKYTGTEFHCLPNAGGKATTVYVMRSALDEKKITVDIGAPTQEQADAAKAVVSKSITQPFDFRNVTAYQVDGKSKWEFWDCTRAAWQEKVSDYKVQPKVGPEDF